MYEFTSGNTKCTMGLLDCQLVAFWQDIHRRWMEDSVKKIAALPGDWVSLSGVYGKVADGTTEI